MPVREGKDKLLAMWIRDVITHDLGFVFLGVARRLELSPCNT